MVPQRPRPRRFLLPLILAAVLAGEITGIALAHTIAAPAPSAPATSVAASAGSGANVVTVPSRDTTADATRDPFATTRSSKRRTLPPRAAQTTRPPALANVAATVKVPVRASVSKVTSKASTGKRSSTGSATGSTYRGTNHVWIPSLGINKGIQSFPCSRNRPPDAGVYRWGCAGTNNVYLLSHAWSTFKPLHDAYNGGRLRKGMKVVYADGAGRVHTYSVIWWKVVAPTTAASWAWASLSTPSMTLQTCVGSKSQYRLMVRLVQVG